MEGTIQHCTGLAVYPTFTCTIVCDLRLLQGTNISHRKLRISRLEHESRKSVQKAVEDSRKPIMGAALLTTVLLVLIQSASSGKTY